MTGTLAIRDINARTCFNSRGELTVEIDVDVGRATGRAMAPAGASVGRHEAQAFPTGGVTDALRLLRGYKTRLRGLSPGDHQMITEELRRIDGTENYQRIGGSVAFALTLAAADAAAKAEGQPLYRLLAPNGPWRLPFPLGNVLGGGRHAGKATPDIQEFLVCPTGAPTILQALQANARVHQEVGKRLALLDHGFTGGKGDEGAWAPRLQDEEALTVASSAIRDVSTAVGFEIRMGLDIASSSFWDEESKVYDYRRSGTRRTPGDQVDYVVRLVKEYRLIYVEDPLHEDAFDEFAELTRKVRDAYIVGDDLLVTNPARLEKAASIGAGNAAILKVNQAGGLGDALHFSETARRKGYALITSHRSGDTPEAHIAHIGIATESIMLKAGVVGGERVAKLNELIRISELGDASEMVRLRF